MGRIFLLSPAKLGGERAQLLLDPRARFPLAAALRSPGGAPLGELMAFASGLYFRGKLAYARAFARPPTGLPGVLVITPAEGLVSPDTRCTAATLAAWGEVDIAADDPRYQGPLARDVRGLADLAPPSEIVLLGSIATGKYLDVLLASLGPRLVFPSEFVGRGDMSRGGLLLRCVDAQRELSYVPVAGAKRTGPRPPKLGPRR